MPNDLIAAYQSGVGTERDVRERRRNVMMKLSKPGVKLSTDTAPYSSKVV